LRNHFYWLKRYKNRFQKRLKFLSDAIEELDYRIEEFEMKSEQVPKEADKESQVGSRARRG
jgi:hypothetical protein